MSRTTYAWVVWRHAPEVAYGIEIRHDDPAEYRSARACGSESYGMVGTMSETR